MKIYCIFVNESGTTDCKEVSSIRQRVNESQQLCLFLINRKYFLFQCSCLQINYANEARPNAAMQSVKIEFVDLEDIVIKASIHNYGILILQV